MYDGHPKDSETHSGFLPLNITSLQYCGTICHVALYWVLMSLFRSFFVVSAIVFGNFLWDENDGY